MPAADPLPSLREPARPHPPAAGSEQAASAARFAGALSQVLRQGDSGGAAAPRGDSPTEEPGRSSHSPTSAEPAEGPPPAVLRAVLVPGAVTDPAPAAAEPAGGGPLPAARAAAVEAAETDADETAALEQEEGAPEPSPAAATAQPAPRFPPVETAQAAAGSASSGAKPGDAAPDGAASHAAGVVPGGGTPNRGAPGREAASAGARSPATGSATAHTPMDPRALVPNTRGPGTGAVESRPLDTSHAPDVPADAAGETARINRGVPASRRTAARGDAASRPEGEPVQDTPPAPDPVPAVVPVAPAATPAPGVARGRDARDVGPDGATSATTAAPAANGPPTLVPAASPASVRVARATPEADSAPPEGVPSPGGETPAAAGATNAPGTADAQPPTAPTADSAPPQPAAQPAHAASSRPAESHPPAGHTAPRAAVDQLAPTLVQVAAGPTAGGGHRTVVRLDPAELGKVEVRVERAEAGPAQVSLTVDRPETLLLLLRDQPALHRALDQAGVPAEGRALHFQLAPATPEGAPADRGGAADWGATADGGKGSGTWNGPGHGQGHGGQPGGRHRGHAPADAATYGTHGAWRDAGLDITA